MALNAKQRVFVAEYLKDKNATRAAKAAGYSKRSAGSIGDELLKKPEIATAIEAGLVKIIEKAELKATDVLAELRKLAFVKLKDAYNTDGTFKNLHDMPEDVQAALNSVETDEIFVGKGKTRTKLGETVKVKLSDKVRVLEILAKHFKLLTEVHEHTGKDGGPVVVVSLPGNGSEAAKPEPKK